MIGDIGMVINGVRGAVMAFFFYILAYYAFLVVNVFLQIKEVTFRPGISIFKKKIFEKEDNQIINKISLI